MTIPTNKMKESFSGDGVTVLFPFTGLSFYQVADLDVLIADVAGVETVLTQNTDYTITNCGTGMPYTYGDVTMIGYYALHPPASGETIVVYRDVPYTQEIDLTAGGAMPAATLEEGYDRNVMQIQQLFDLIGRTVTLPISSPLTGLTLPTPEALLYLRWNALANNLENMDIASIGALSVSAYWKTILDETSLADSLTALGLDADLATFSLPASTTISAFIKTLLDDADAAAARATIGAMTTADVPAAQELPTRHITGLDMVHAADTGHDITIAVGKCRDSTDAADIVLAAALTKQADAAWAVGSAAGGMDTGSIPASGTLHVWLIKRTDTGVVDALFSISATTPTMPASYDYKRLIGSYRTDASNNIINGDWWGNGINRAFMFDTPILDVDTATPGTNAVTAAISTPAGIITRAFMNVQSDGASAIYVSSLANADLPPSNTAAPLSSSGCNGVFRESGGVSAFTNTSSQIRYRSGADVHTYIATLGYEMSL